MGRLVLFIVIVGTVVQTLRMPFVGPMAYYCLAIWGPQYVWFWSFEGLRVSLAVALATFAALGLTFFKHGLPLGLLNNRIHYCVLALWIAYQVSYNFAPYVPYMGMAPSLKMEQFNKIILFYFVSVLLVNDLPKMKFFSYVMIAAMFHLTFWANYQYVSQNWQAFFMGRLMGPRVIGYMTIYQDENTFAMFFVTGIPFLYYWGLNQAKGVFRYAVWGVIPFAWHAIFLTGSRGGLVGLAATLFANVIYSKNRKIIFLIIIPLFAAAFFLQGGDVLKSRSETIVEHEGEGSVEGRFQAWRAAMKMLDAHTFTGVGVECFIKAMGDYSDKKPRKTHSVPFQYAAEVGVIGFLSYCLIVLFVLWNGYQNHRRLGKHESIFSEKEIQTLWYLNGASSTSFFGLTVCSLFLSLNYYEVFYFLLIISCYITFYILRRIQSGAVLRA